MEKFASGDTSIEGCPVAKDNRKMDEGSCHLGRKAKKWKKVGY